MERYNDTIMAVREVLQIGDERLKAPNTAIDDFKGSKVQQVVRDLIDTMHEKQLIGMAAPQIGENYQIFVTEPRATAARTGASDELRVYINPRIVDNSKSQVVIYEGCGSVLHGQLFGPVKRPKIITIEAWNEKGKCFGLRCDGILARVIQHEYDHLQGTEFTEKVSDYRQLMTVDFYKERVKNLPEQVAAARITVVEEL